MHIFMKNSYILKKSEEALSYILQVSLMSVFRDVASTSICSNMLFWQKYIFKNLVLYKCIAGKQKSILITNMDITVDSLLW